jgi:hypothetical protein
MTSTNFSSLHQIDIMSHLKPLLELNQVQWGKYMLDIYIGQQGPQPLGTVVFEEIEEKAREKLKQWPGAFYLISTLTRRN